jgi:predicted nucleic acid-binding protein
VKLIVSDASPLIVIAKSGLIPVLTRLVEEIIVPHAVYAECTVDIAMPGAQAIRTAVESGRIQVRPDIARQDDGPGDELAGLGAGERAAIHMAAALDCPVLMDERLGRQVAKRKGIAVIGSAGLLLVARKRGLIPAVAPILDQWRQSGYFLSASVVKAILERAGEA